MSDAQKDNANAHISGKLLNMLNAVFESFMEKLMNALDNTIDQQRTMANKNSWLYGLVRTKHIDRNRVYDSYQKALV